MADGNSRSKKRRAKNKQDTTVTLEGVSADGIGDSFGGNVETRHDAGDQPTKNSAVQTARKLLQKMALKRREVNALMFFLTRAFIMYASEMNSIVD